MTEPTEERAPLGHPAEAETPIHDHEPQDGTDDGATRPLEESEEYQLAAEDGAPLPPPEGGQAAQGDDDGPVFLEPTVP